MNKNEKRNNNTWTFRIDINWRTLRQEKILYPKHRLENANKIAKMYAKNTASVRLSEKCEMTRTKEETVENGEKYFVYELMRANESQEKAQMANTLA